MNRSRLSKNDIDNKAIEVMSHFDINYYKYVRKTPLLQIANFFSEKYKVKFDFESSLGFNENGSRILGYFSPKPREIFVDKSLISDASKFNFVLAHEIGHLVLHRKLNLSQVYDESQDDIIIDHITGKRRLKTEEDFVEWQASYFAAAFLMPKPLFKKALEMIQKDMGIARRGYIYLDSQPCNIKDYNILQSKLSLIFEVSRSSAKYRLNDLKLVNDYLFSKSYSADVPDFVKVMQSMS